MMLGKQITLNDMESVVSKSNTSGSHHRPFAPHRQVSETIFAVPAVVIGTVTPREVQGGIACLKAN